VTSTQRKIGTGITAQYLCPLHRDEAGK
jgi:hypothetical protein